MSDPSHRPGAEDRALLPVGRGGKAKANEWAMVLASQGIEAHVVRALGGMALEVTNADFAAAETILADYVSEKQAARQAELAAEQDDKRLAPQGPPWAGVLVALILLAIHAYSGERADHGLLFERGSAVAKLILAGEWWRCVTALFLHANLGHVVGNAFAGILFIGVCCRILGLGLGIALVLAAGTLGNALNALVQDPMHSSVGASTAVFGSIGVLTGLAVARRHRAGLREKPAWVPIGAGLALLAMLGTSGERVDLWAHFFGLLIGALLGAGTAWRMRALPSLRAQWVLGSAALALSLACWCLALR